MDKKKIFWGIFSVVIAALSIWAVVAQNKNFSVDVLLKFISESNKVWLIAGAFCMFGFIFFEGYALVRIVNCLGYKKSAGHGTVYGAADVYFSAITPSASGGQPASAYFMMKDGMPGTSVTVALLLNLIMYTLALLTLGIICMIFRMDLFFGFSLFSRTLIIIGVVVLVFLAFIFYMLIKKASILYKFCNAILIFLEKIHVLRHGQRKRDKLNKTMDEYQECAQIVSGKWNMLLEVYFWNLMQRISQIAVSFMIFMATGEGIIKSFDVCVIQTFVAVGSNSVPIPGSMGVADYIMLDGFSQVVGDNATTMELLCRGMTFYGCVITSAAIVLFGYVHRRIKAKKGQTIVG